MCVLFWWQEDPSYFDHCDAGAIGTHEKSLRCAPELRGKTDHRLGRSGCVNGHKNTHSRFTGDPGLRKRRHPTTGLCLTLSMSAGALAMAALSARSRRTYNTQVYTSIGEQLRKTVVLRTGPRPRSGPARKPSNWLLTCLVATVIDSERQCKCASRTGGGQRYQRPGTWLR